MGNPHSPDLSEIKALLEAIPTEIMTGDFVVKGTTTGEITLTESGETIDLGAFQIPTLIGSVHRAWVEIKCSNRVDTSSTDNGIGTASFINVENNADPGYIYAIAMLPKCFNVLADGIMGFISINGGFDVSAKVVSDGRVNCNWTNAKANHANLLLRALEIDLHIIMSKT